MTKISNFDLEALNIFFKEQEAVGETVEGTFQSSGADEYFRVYDYSEKYFSEDREILYGKEFPLEIRTGIPEDDETSEFYTFYAYAKNEEIE